MRLPYDSRQRPMLPLRLRVTGVAQEVLALVDSGADVNVLPWTAGLNLGLAWNPRKATIRVAGVPQGAAAMPVLLQADFGELHAVIP